MASYQFSFGGKTFKVSGPDGLTADQAQQAFNTQASTGALTGLSPGSILNAAKQAAAGVASALGQVGQIASGITGALGGGIANAVGTLGTLTGVGGSASSLVDRATSTLKNIVGSTSIPNGITSADFSKTVSAVAPIAGLNPAQVTGTLSAVSGLVNQASSLMSNSKGVGNFGLDATQLEKAGFLKPGTSKFITGTGLGKLTSVLKSPSVFTGKDGVNNIDGLLKNPSLQSITQQGLMASGVAGLATQGIDVPKLPKDLQGGIASIASKSLDAATSLAKGAAAGVTGAISSLTAGMPSPGDIMKECSFATNFVSNILPEPFKEQEIPEPATDTANRATVDAATNRVIGDPKIPSPNFGPPILKAGTYDASGRQLTGAEVNALING